MDSRQGLIFWVVGRELIIPQPNFLSFFLSFFLITSVIFLPVLSNVKRFIGAPVHFRGRIHSRQDSSGRVISPKKRLLPDNTQQTDIHAPVGIRTRNPSKRAAADPRLRPCCHWDRHNAIYCHDATAASRPGPADYRGSMITFRHTTVGRTPLDK